MVLSAPESDSRLTELADEAVATARRWVAESAETEPDPHAQRLAGLLKDPHGLEFTIGFVDRVIRPESLRVAGRNLERLSRHVPTFLPAFLRIVIVLGGGFALLFPWPIVPIARRVFRSMVSHLVIDATPAKLAKSLSQLREEGVRLNLNLLGEAVLGDDEAARRLNGTRELLSRDDVDYVSIKVSSVASQLSMWAFEEMADLVVTRLTPLYELAAASDTPKFINLDMEEYRDLDLTVAVFQRLLDQPTLANLEAGIAIQAYLPDALSALQGLSDWATRRRASGGAPIKVRVVKGANLAMERVDAMMHGWPLAPFSTKLDTDANYKRLLNWALTPERTDAVRIGVAGHNLFDIAFAWLLAKQRGVGPQVEFEMLLGMASSQAAAVKKDVGGLLLYTPVVHPDEFDSAINYLVRRLEENASSENFMSSIFELGAEAVFEREAERFIAAVTEMNSPAPTPNRIQNRESEPAPASSDSFNNEPDTDPSIAANREWGTRILARSADSSLGTTTIQTARVETADAVDAVLESAVRAGADWAARSADDRERLLQSAGDALAANRASLIEVMASEAGKTIGEGDIEVSEAVDFAHYYAERIAELDAVEGARYRPPRVTVVTPPWNFPLAIPAGSVLAALAAGSAVILKPARLARRTGAVLAETLWTAGIPRELLTLIDVESSDLRRQLVMDERVDRVILTGSWETAKALRSWRADLPLLGETSGKNAITVTPSADLDLAVADIVRSAFSHAGQKCSAASLVILVGSVATSERFERQLVDAVRTLRVGYPQNPASQMGPIIEPAQGKLRIGLTTLGPDERWLIEPRELDESGRLWSPGVRTGVLPGSDFHRTEYFGPVLGVMTAATLDEAIELQNAVDYGLTAGIHSLDPHEVSVWLNSVQAGNLYVNRGITGAIVRRQPFGGWKRSSVGPNAKAGGPNYVMALGSWEPVETEPASTIKIKGLSRDVASVIKRAQVAMDFAEFDRVRRAAVSDQDAWASEFGISRDISQLGIERNVLRYRPVPVTIRLSEGEPIGHLVRVIAAAALARAPLSLSSPVPLPTTLVQSFAEPIPSAIVHDIVIESDAAWLARIGELRTPRIRLIGGDARALAKALYASESGDVEPTDVAIWSGPVTTAGRVELLPFLHEQSVSITAHRFGNPDPDMASIPV
ncbi:MAG: aldehyde dehydrogenase family protein [Salinibacterium sp.]|nr:MAG: aldehyde dehydrogenase family protein [Salinibacterium sp.]